MLTKTETEFLALQYKLSSEGFRCIYRRMLDEACPQCGFMSLARASYAKGDDRSVIKLCLHCGHEVSHTRVTQLRLL